LISNYNHDALIPIPVVVEVVPVEAVIAVELMDQQILPRIVNTGMLIPTVEHVGMIVQRIMIVQHVIMKHQDINLQQPELIQWEDPQKTKNSQNGTDVVGSNKQIILKRKRLIQQQKQ
jgi:tRNA A-37 threonylcarbamoyl transferase component Bud32